MQVEDRSDDYNEKLVISASATRRIGMEWRKKFGHLSPTITKEILFQNSPKQCFLLHNVLSSEECEFLIRGTEKLGYEVMSEYSSDYRSNTRLILDNPELTDVLWKRSQSNFHVDKVTKVIVVVRSSSK
jgi:hypothetical protein